jgi:hypothetical protein
MLLLLLQLCLSSLESLRWCKGGERDCVCVREGGREREREREIGIVLDLNDRSV